MPRPIQLSELPSLTGEMLGTSDEVVITQKMIDAFADVTGDHQWIHTDPERAAEGPFGTTIAHGYLTLSLIPQLMHQAVSVEGPSMAVNYGLNRCRFPAPVPSGSKVFGELRLTEVQELGDGALQSTVEVSVQVSGGDKPACVAEVLTRYYP